MPTSDPPPDDPQDAAGPVVMLMRHAKAAWPQGVADHERPLADRGRGDAPHVGRWLAERGLAPDLVLSSDSLRTRQTTDLVLGALADTGPARGSAVEVTWTEELYEASVPAVLHLLAEVPDEIRRVLVVGHEPTSSRTTAVLTGSAPEFPTAAVAVVRLAGRWRDVRQGSGTLQAFRTPKG